MKKQLLTVLLTFTTISCSAIQQPTNAELLAHLKSVKIELLNNLESIEENVSTFALNLLEEFYNSSKFLQKYVSHTVNGDLKLICNMATWEDVLYSPIQKPIVITNADIKDLSQLFKSIYTKLHQNYCNDNPNGELVNVTAQDMFEDICKAIIYSDGIIMTKALIKKIDTKIAELEKQN